MNHGSTMRTSQAKPASGRSANSQRAERSKIDSVTAARPTIIRLTGPLIRMPAASAVQKIAGNIQPSRALPASRGER